MLKLLFYKLVKKDNALILRIRGYAILFYMNPKLCKAKSIYRRNQKVKFIHIFLLIVQNANLRYSLFVNQYIKYNCNKLY